MRDHQDRHGGDHDRNQSKRLICRRQFVSEARHLYDSHHHQSMDRDVATACGRANKNLTQHRLASRNGRPCRNGQRRRDMIAPDSASQSMMWYPPSINMTPPVISFAPSSARKAVAAPTSSILTRLRLGAVDCALSINLSNSGIPEAARVASGPGEMACTR